MAETIALLLPAADGVSSPLGLRAAVEGRLLLFQDDVETSLRDSILGTWREMDDRQRLVWNKMITGDLRVGISRQTIIRALGELAGLESTVISHRLMSAWEPTEEFFRWLLSPDRGDTDVSRPYPLQLAFPLDALPETLGDRRQWCAEWKRDGIRAQVVKRGGMAFIWSRSGELLGRTFPELADAAATLPDGTVIDGEILPWKDGSPLPFSLLQKRIGRQSPTRKILEEIPVIFMAFDLLESQGKDIRTEPLRNRRAELERILGQRSFEGRLRLSEILKDATWEDLTARRRGVAPCKPRGSCSSTSIRPTRRGGTGAAGGSGRSSLTRSTRSSSTPGPGRLGGKTFLPITPSGFGAGATSFPWPGPAPGSPMTKSGASTPSSGRTPSRNSDPCAP